MNSIERRCWEALSCTDLNRDLPNATDLRFLARRGLIAMRSHFSCEGKAIGLPKERQLASVAVCAFGGYLAEPLGRNSQLGTDQLAYGYCGIIYSPERLRKVGGRLLSPEDYRRELYVTCVHELVHWYYLIRYGRPYRAEISVYSQQRTHETHIETLSQQFVTACPEEERYFLRPLERARRSGLDVYPIARLREHYVHFPTGELSLAKRLEAFREQMRHFKRS